MEPVHPQIPLFFGSWAPCVEDKVNYGDLGLDPVVLGTLGHGCHGSLAELCKRIRPSLCPRELVRVVTVVFHCGVSLLVQ